MCTRSFSLLALLVGIGTILAAGLPVRYATAQDTETVTVDAGDARVEVATKPFGLRVLDDDGREVLRSVDNTRPDPYPLAPTPQRQPGGGETTPEQPPLYAPVTFTVGDETVVQYPGSFWAADILTGASAGVQYALTDVTAVERTGDGRGAVLTVATNDPSGRTATVTVAPDRQGTAKVAVEFDDDGGLAVTAASFVTDGDEAFHGFGGRRNATDQRGEDFYNWIEEFAQRPDQFDWVANFPGLDERYQFPTGAQGAYYVQSLFVSSRPYGFFLERPELSRWRMASDREDAWQAAVAAPQLEFVVAAGDPPAVIEDLTSITGRNPVPPQWALGPMVSRAVEPFNGSPEQYAQRVENDLDAIEKYDLPLTAMSIEGWPWLEDAGVLEDVLDRMHRMGLKPVIYYKAFVGGGEGYERDRVFDEAVDNGYVATTPTGQPYLFGSPLGRGGQAAMIDFTDPEAVDWYQDRIVDGLDLGAEGFMQDFGEQVFVDMQFDDGSTGWEMHNRFPVLYHRATQQALREYAAENPGREPWFFVRAGYSGRPGSAAYEPTNWGGDNTADWSRASGIASVVPDMLNRSVGGAVGYTTDIGGYIDTFGHPSPELFLRWAHLASLIPVNRVHGGPNNGTHMPWIYDDEVLEAYRGTIRRHIAAQPLIRDLWREARATGMPIARPLWLHHPDDPQARAQEQQWLLGPDVLVAPAVEEGATDRDVYFPEGCWEHPERGDRHRGPATEKVDAPIDVLPYYFRCGTQPFDVAAIASDGDTGRPDSDHGPGATTDGAPSGTPATGGGAALVAVTLLGAALAGRRR